VKLMFLGTGTSHGIPAIGCTCSVCTSADPRNRRRRSSIHIEAENYHLLVDTPPDFRDQVLTFGVRRVDAVLLTHAHADHIFGFDDLRRFCFMQDMRIPVYGSDATLADMRVRFDYIFKTSFWSSTVPQVDLTPLSPCAQLGPFTVRPFEAPHGPMKVWGYRITYKDWDIAYLPDCSQVTQTVLDAVRGVDIMILDALRRKPHPTHLCLEESIAGLQKIGARASYLTHLCHDLDHAQTARELPDRIHVAYDGLILDKHP